MTYTKLVNGKTVEMDSQEIATRQAEEATWEIEKSKPKPKTLEDRVSAIEAHLNIKDG